ncbi:MAG: DUF4214 domain-containing protein [Telluria sp.]
MIDSFGNSDESKALYPGDGATFITAIYQNLFNRDPDSAGLQYWASNVNSGAMSRSIAALAIAAGTQGSDGTAVDNKTTAAATFTASLDTDAKKAAYSGLAANAVVHDVLSNVDATTAPSTLGAYVASTVDYLNKPSPQPSVFSVSPAIATVGKETLFTVSGLGLKNTLNSVDNCTYHANYAEIPKGNSSKLMILCTPTKAGASQIEIDTNTNPMKTLYKGTLTFVDNSQGSTGSSNGTQGGTTTPSSGGTQNASVSCLAHFSLSDFTSKNPCTQLQENAQQYVQIKQSLYSLEGYSAITTKISSCYADPKLPNMTSIDTDITYMTSKTCDALDTVTSASSTGDTVNGGGTSTGGTAGGSTGGPTGGTSGGANGGSTTPGSSSGSTPQIDTISTHQVYWDEWTQITFTGHGLNGDMIMDAGPKDTYSCALTSSSSTSLTFKCYFKKRAGVYLLSARVVDSSNHSVVYGYDDSLYPSVDPRGTSSGSTGGTGSTGTGNGGTGTSGTGTAGGTGACAGYKDILPASTRSASGADPQCSDYVTFADTTLGKAVANCQAGNLAAATQIYSNYQTAVKLAVDSVQMICGGAGGPTLPGGVSGGGNVNLYQCVTGPGVVIAKTCSGSGTPSALIGAVCGWQLLSTNLTSTQCEAEAKK